MSPRPERRRNSSASRTGPGRAAGRPTGRGRNRDAEPDREFAEAPRLPRSSERFPARSARPAGPSRSAPGARSNPNAPATEETGSPVLLARIAADVAKLIERHVREGKGRADKALAAALRKRKMLTMADRRFIHEAIMALLRWSGWLPPKSFPEVRERLLFSWMLDAPKIHPVCRVWARDIEFPASRLLAMGEAPNWKARSEAVKRVRGDRPLVADPWRLFPDWVRHQLPDPPGLGNDKARVADFLQSLQRRPPLWTRARRKLAPSVWKDLHDRGAKPWVHRRVPNAAKIPREIDLYSLPVFERGEIEIQDLASQAVGLVCAPKPGQRWWDVCAGGGGKALQLADEMDGKGLVVATDVAEHKLRETVRRARRAGLNNISTKVWDEKTPPGKPMTFDGVLVDAPCSALGTWRRNPEARWMIDQSALERLAALQRAILEGATKGVKPGGVLVYSVCSLTLAETRDVVNDFLADHPEFKLDPFPNPLDGQPTPGLLWIWPAESDTDGLFIARMLRIPNPETDPKPKTKSKSKPKPASDVDAAKSAAADGPPKARRSRPKAKPKSKPKKAPGKVREKPPSNPLKLD